MSFVVVHVGGSAEEQIKRELQAVAEGVAASVFHSVSSNADRSLHSRSDSPPISQQNPDAQPSIVETQQRDKFNVL